MKRNQHNIRFSPEATDSLAQNQSYFILRENDKDIKLRFHDYAELYKRKGLYEQLYYDRLKCVSPEKIVGALSSVLRQSNIEITQLRVLDFGAGNGMVGELLYEQGVARVVGVDICEEAFVATERDRPAVYDAYYVCDITNPDESTKTELDAWGFDCLTSVAALGFGDIPPAAFTSAFNLIKNGGWIAFNIKETFLQQSDNSGFSTLVKTMLNSDILEVHHLERYRHRISINGKSLFYYAIIGKKESDIPKTIIHQIAVEPVDGANDCAGFVS